MPDFIIDDDTPPDVTHAPQFARGLVPRDLDADPPEMFAAPSEIPLIPRSEWDARIGEQEAQQSSLEHVIRRAGIPSLDQNPWGYCWAHSTTQAVIARRAADGQPYVPLSAFAVAAIIKKGKNEGGWCGLSAKFAREVGIPAQSFWPQKNVDLRHDTPAMRENAALHKTSEEWVDLTRPVWGENLTFDQVATCLLLNLPCPVDLNWWAHSVCAVRLVRVEAGSYGIKIWNSWGDQWGDKGMGVLRGSKAKPDGALCVRVTGASET